MPSDMTIIKPHLDEGVHYVQFPISRGDVPKLEFCSGAFLYNKVLFTESAFENFPQMFKFWLAYPEYWKLLRRNEYQVIDYPILYLSHPYDCNFSHFTLQCLPGLLMAKTAGIISKELRIIVADEKPFQKQFLKLLGCVNLKIVKLEQNKLYKLTNCLYCTSLYDFLHGKEFVKYFESAARRLELRVSPDIYITRNNNSLRPATNELEVIEFLHKRGFEIFDFDRLPVAVQIALFRSARHICAAHGASGANLAWISPAHHFKFTEIFSSNRTAYCHASLLQAKDCDYSATVNRAVAPARVAGPDAPFTINLELLDYALQNPIYKFKATDGQNNAENELKKLADSCASFISEPNKLLIEAEHLRSEGKIAEAIATLKKSDINLHRHGGINLLLKLTFMDMDLEEYKALVNYILAQRFQDCYCALSEFSMLTSNYGFAREIQNLLKKHGKDGIANYYSQMISYFEKLPLNILMTWHFTIVRYDAVNKTIVNIKENNSNIQFVVKGNRIFLYVPEVDGYIAEISQSGECLIAKDEVSFEIVPKNQFNFVIVKDGLFLSARPNGTFCWMPHPLEWERFFLKQHV